MTEEIKFLITRDVKNPSRGFPTDAGIDFFVPTFNKEFVDYILSDKSNRETFNCNTPQSELEELKEEYITKPWLSDVNPCGIFLTSSDVVSSPTMTSDPVRNNPKDFFGFDIREGKPYFILGPQKRVKIPSGIKCRMTSPGRALIAANKSGIAVNHGLVF